jgi:hypothetical protein
LPVLQRSTAGVEPQENFIAETVAQYKKIAVAATAIKPRTAKNIVL